MQSAEETEARLIATELVGFQFILNASNIRTINKMEPLLYRRKRDQAKREGTLESFDYFDCLDGKILEDSFDPALGTTRQASLAKGIMRIINGTTLRSRTLDWAAKRLEMRINRRNKNPLVYLHVEIGEFAWPTYVDSEPRLTFRFWKEILPPAAKIGAVAVKLVLTE